MSVPKNDVIATVLVAAAGVLYLMWVAGSSPAGLDGVRSSGMVILALGFMASATAVVPSFEELLHGNRIYLAVMSLLGLVAVIGGVLMLVDESSAGLGVVMGAMVVLWLIATIHHSLLAKKAPRAPVGKVGWTDQGRDPADLVAPRHGAHPRSDRITHARRRIP